jgi:hypothetical protein
MTLRKPERLKIVAGTWRGDRAVRDEPGLPALDAVPQPPAWMTDVVAVREFR